MAGKYRLTTLGCKVNQYESQQIRELLESYGLEPAAPSDATAIAVVNTCAVTGTALRKSRQTIRRLARGGSDVVVVGCGAAADSDAIRRIPGTVGTIDHSEDLRAALEPFIKSALEKPLARAPSTSKPNRSPNNRANPINPHGPASRSPGAEKVWAERSEKPSTHNIVAELFPIVNDNHARIGRIERFDGHQRAFLKVQDGCDAHCTYCIIPRLRPSLAWKPVDDAVLEAHALVRAGHREIIVTGIFLGAYGRETAIRKRSNGAATPLADLVAALARVEGLERLRLSSLEPGDVDDSLLEVMATHECCVPHLHLPLQSGSGDILRRMNRQYTIDAFIDMIDRVRAALDRPAVTTDIIVGFPGEGADDFEQTLEIVHFAEFAKIHAFPFSSRNGTAAAKWTGQHLPGPVVKKRLRALEEAGHTCALQFRRRILGTVERVLVEDVVASTSADGSASRIARGRADRYFEIHFDACGKLGKGDMAHVRIDRVTPTRTHGTEVEGTARETPLPVLSG